MHIITGLIAAALLGKRSKDKESSSVRSLPNFTGLLETKHSLPGRVRFRVPALREDVAGRETAAREMPRIQGVESVEVNPITGSVLIRYQPGRVEPEMLFAVLARLLDLEHELDRAVQPLIAKELRRLGAAANHAVYESSHGLIDLWTGIPLALAVWGLRKVLREGLGSVPSGFILLWWSYMALLPGDAGDE